jgi:hypothetical protein
MCYLFLWEFANLLLTHPVRTKIKGDRKLYSRSSVLVNSIIRYSYESTFLGAGGGGGGDIIYHLCTGLATVI